MIFILQFSSINFMFELTEKLIPFSQPVSALLTVMFIRDRLTAVTNYLIYGSVQKFPCYKSYKLCQLFTLAYNTFLTHDINLFVKNMIPFSTPPLHVSLRR